MKSIATKITTLIIVAIIFTIFTVGGVSIYRLEVSMKDNSNEILNLTCDDIANALDITLKPIEQAVDTIARFAIDNLNDPEDLSDDVKYNNYLEHLYHLSYTVANETQGSNSIYFRFNPELTDPMAGFFLTKDYNTGLHSIDAPKTDLSKYPVNDLENCNWFYAPLISKQPTWLTPYYNVVHQEFTIISYVNPIFIDDVFIGVIGMDVEFSLLSDLVDNILLYETGFSFLTDSNLAIIHSKTDLSSVTKIDITKLEEDNELIFSYKIDDSSMKITFRELLNGMFIAVTAPQKEINKSLNTLITQLIFLLIVLMTVFITVTVYITRKIVNPLKSLTLAANEIANGNLDVEINCSSKDEVGILAKSMTETVKMLKIRVDYIENLAKLDKLTSLNNTTSYRARIDEINDEIKYGLTSYAVFIIDLNGLKNINDTYGHQYGDELILETSRIISSVFGTENSYRIGGDEFAVILSGCDLASSKLFYNQLEKKFKSQKGKIKPKVAIGYEVYDKELFNSYEEVFKSADKKMYDNKEVLKAKGINSKIN